MGNPPASHPMLLQLGIIQYLPENPDTYRDREIYKRLNQRTEPLILIYNKSAWHYPNKPCGNGQQNNPK